MIMNNTSEAPFYIGQRVVALLGCSNAAKISFKRGDVLVVKDCVQCSCGKWYVDIGNPTIQGSGTLCPSCSRQINYDFKWLSKSSSFAPIQESYSDATAEILEKFPITEETPDKLLTPQTINQ